MRSEDEDARSKSCHELGRSQHLYIHKSLRAEIPPDNLPHGQDRSSTPCLRLPSYVPVLSLRLLGFPSPKLAAQCKIAPPFFFPMPALQQPSPTQQNPASSWSRLGARSATLSELELLDILLFPDQHYTIICTEYGSQRNEEPVAHSAREQGTNEQGGRSKDLQDLQDPLHSARG